MSFFTIFHSLCTHSNNKLYHIKVSYAVWLKVQFYNFDKSVLSVLCVIESWSLKGLKHHLLEICMGFLCRLTKETACMLSLKD